jgi:hypothetical protein
VTAADQRLSFQNLFGELGPEQFVTGHWSAGIIDESLYHALQMCKGFHAEHARKGWGGIGYHYCISRGGVIIGLRPTLLKGAHVGRWNTGNIGILFHGGKEGHKVDLTAKQINSLRWLLQNAHTRRMPIAHRTDNKLARPHCERRSHNDWSGHESNECMGTFEREFKAARNR